MKKIILKKRKKKYFKKIEKKVKLPNLFYSFYKIVVILLLVCILISIKTTFAGARYLPNVLNIFKKEEQKKITNIKATKKLIILLLIFQSN